MFGFKLVRKYKRMKYDRILYKCKPGSYGIFAPPQKESMVLLGT